MSPKARAVAALAVLAGLPPLAWLATVHGASAVHRPARAADAQRSAPTPDAELAAWLQRFSLNALLVPLLDGDELPLRWGDTSTSMPAMNCRSAAVLVDGSAVAPLEEIRRPTFTVSWRMNGCLPFGLGGPQLSGQAELDVRRDGDGFTATVRPHPLIASVDGRVAVLDRPFASHTP